MQHYSVFMGHMSYKRVFNLVSSGLISFFSDNNHLLCLCTPSALRLSSWVCWNLTFCLISATVAKWIQIHYKRAVTRPNLLTPLH